MGKGLGASRSSCGKIVFTADDAVEWAAKGEKVVLVTSGDISGRYHRYESAQGILTVRGGMTSHAAVVAVVWVHAVYLVVATSQWMKR